MRLGRMDPQRRAEARLVQRMREGRPMIGFRNGRTPIIVAHRTHGLRSTYVDGCRCDACTDAEADYSYGRRRSR